MPIYEYECDRCKGIIEKIQSSSVDAPTCCGIPMRKRPTTIAFAKMKGMGGYPSLRKAVQGGPQYYDKKPAKTWV